MSQEIIYPGRDLEAMSFALNYHKWILQIFAPHLGRRVIEVGAGSGSFSELLLTHNLDSLAVIEPSTDMYKLLQGYLQQAVTNTQIIFRQALFRTVAEELKALQQPDSVIYVNVLEHVEDDAAELAAVYETLPMGGKLFIFVPALRWLYSAFDQSIGHFRRYSKSELETKCRQAGFRVVQAAYFDFLGIAPWWLKYRLLKSLKMEPQAVAVYDNYFVPVTKAMESRVTPPLGKNLILIAEKVWTRWKLTTKRRNLTAMTKN